MKKNVKTICLLTALIIFLFGSNSIAQNSLQRYIPKFGYDPKTRTQVANTGITIAVVTPYFEGRNDDAFVTVLQNFKSVMGSELEELLIAKGYKVRGPFSTRDEMIYEDKRQADFTLVVAIQWDAKEVRNIKKIFGPGGWKDKKGQLRITNGLDVIAVSNFTGEKLWKKHFTLNPQEFTWTGSVDLKVQDVTFWKEYDLDNNLAEPLGKALESSYNQYMEILWNQFEINEITNIVKQAQLERAADKQVK